MCNSCININADQYDPSYTTTLRNMFARKMNARFNELAKAVKISIGQNDCLGLREIASPALNQLTPIPSKAFAFKTSQEKIELFMEWLREQAELGILDIRTVNMIGRSLEQPWTNVYIESAYKRGITRAYTEMKKAGYDVPTLDQAGGIDTVFNTPIHAEKVGILFARTFSDLRGITENMDMQISRVLAQGLADGKNPVVIARELNKVITGMGEDISLTDTLGRFIPAKRRAEILARTEILRAYNQGLISEYRGFGVIGIKVKAEWSTSGDKRVCSRCISLDGQIFTLDEIEGMLPLHPLCRCIALPQPIN